MSRKDVAFILICIAALLTIIVYSLVASYIFKVEQARKNPYYFCDAEWRCCTEANCDTALKTKSIGLKADPTSYLLTDKFGYTSPYYQNCVLPVQNATLNYDSTVVGQTFDFTYIYNPSEDVPTTNPSIYYPGCLVAGEDYTGTDAKCTDPKYNVIKNTRPYCPYVSADQYAGNSGDPANYALPYGVGDLGQSYTLTPSNYNSASNQSYIAGLGSGGTSTSNYQLTIPGFPNSNVSTVGYNKANLLDTNWY